MDERISRSRRGPTDDGQRQGPDVATLYAWLARSEDPLTTWDKPAERVAVWYAGHIQTAALRRLRGVDWLQLRCTFAAKPRRRALVLPLVAEANVVTDRCRWYAELRPMRLVCALDLPAAKLDEATFLREWRQFHDEVLATGIDLTLRTRAERWKDLVVAKSGGEPLAQ